MALVGSTGSTGRRKPVELHTRATAQRAGSYDANTPDPQELAKMRQAQELSDSNYSAGDFASQVYNFPGKVYDDADQSVRGLLGLLSSAGSNVLNDQAPFEGVEADPIISDMLHNWTHPVEYANEHPFGFMGDVAGAAALGGGALASGAERFGTSIPAWLSDETGAVGNLGKLLESERGQGNIMADIENLSMATRPGEGPAMIPSRGSTSTAGAPNLGLVTEFGEANQGLGLLKPGSGASGTWNIDQIGSQLGYEDLWNRVGLGDDIPKPASAAADFEYAPYIRENGAYNTPEPEMTSGLVQEFVQNALDAKDPKVPSFKNPEFAQDVQDISLMDYITGNSDRSFTHNLMGLEGRPMPIDEGMAFKTSSRPSPEDPHLSDWNGLVPTPEQMPGLELSPRSRQILETAYAEMNQSMDPEWHMDNYDTLYENVPEDEILLAMERSDNALKRGTLFGDPIWEDGGIGWRNGMGGFDDIEQPAEVFNPPPGAPGWMQLQKALLEEAGSGSSPWEPSPGEFLSPTEHLGSEDMRGLVNMNASGIPQVFDEFTTLGPSEIPLSTSQRPSLSDILALLQQQIPGI